MRRGAALATASLSVLLSLALGTSAVALREEPQAHAERAAVEAHDVPSGALGAERLAALPRPAVTTVPAAVADAPRAVVDDGRGAGGSPSGTSSPPEAQPAPAPTAAPQPPPEPAVAAPAAAPDCAALACVALTFDDGPGPDTGRLLDELAARAVHATFFVVGRQIAKEPGAVAREVAAGHVVGNHTWDHAMLPSLSDEALAAELDTTSQAIVAEGAPAPTLARPPYGSLSPSVTQAFASRGMAGVLWDVDTEDWKNRDAGVTTERALAGAHPGAIILMHDIHPSTVDAVPGLVDALRARGFTLVTVPQLLATPVAGGVYAHR
ncbi:polysaccharide deacetylase family protein [Cellulomonas sp. SG140]|uniref:polysaccharide deacetylase family protein n=1 Tax=Cellulomonas sp. SG140 TaxID=2976536 RepID=UPI0021E6E4F0|nr:polysaccharide deacetylase family protein [Cellulomonas sp. SG140]